MSKDKKHHKHKENACSCCNPIIQQEVNLDMDQDQVADQDNLNVQLAAIAVALGGGLAKASQTSKQSNENSQKGKAIGLNKVDFVNRQGSACADVEQQANTNFDQEQEVEQENENLQLVTLAVADDRKSVAISTECNNQENENKQAGVAAALNKVFPSKDWDNLEDSQKKDQVNPADTEKAELESIALSPEHSFAINVAFNQNGDIMEVIADDKGEVKVNEIKASNVNPNMREVNNVLISFELDGDHMEISADENGNVLVNGEKI